jgi:pyruvate-formate lyase-activating enzyme
MSTTTDIDSEIRARVAEQIRKLEAQGNDPVFQLDLIYDLFRRIHAGEMEYGMPWQEAHAAVRSGKIHETHEVCVWLMDIALLDEMIAES